MQMRDILSPTLAADRRLQGPPSTLRRVFSSEFYDVSICQYSGILTCLVLYKRESLRIMSTLWEDQVPGDRIPAAVERLKREGKSPLHLVRDTKLESGYLLTLHDRAALRLAGVEIPRSAGRYKDLFDNESS